MHVECITAPSYNSSTTATPILVRNVINLLKGMFNVY